MIRQQIVVALEMTLILQTLLQRKSKLLPKASEQAKMKRELPSNQRLNLKLMFLLIFQASSTSRTLSLACNQNKKHSVMRF